MMETSAQPFYFSYYRHFQADLVTLPSLPMNNYPPLALEQLIFHPYCRLHPLVTVPLSVVKRATSWKGSWNEIYAVLLPPK